MADQVRTYASQLPEHAKSSPFSVALQELLAQSGGIYLSLVLLVSFLNIEIADKWRIMGMDTEPIALLALVVAALQPLFLKIYRMFKGR